MTNRDNSSYNIVPTCPICQDPNKIMLQFTKKSYRIYRCQECTVLFVYPQPSDEVLNSLYDEEYFRRGNKYTLNVRSPHLDPNRRNALYKIELLRCYQPSGALLDVGCGMGHFLQIAKERGYNVTGVEISESAVEYIRQHFDLDVVNSDLMSAGFSPESFDIITLWDVIEHLKAPHLLLAKIYQLLRPGGFLVLSTGDVSSMWARLTGRYWPLLTPPQHLFFYTPQSLRTILTNNKLPLQEILYTEKRATLDFILFKACETFGSIVKPIQTLISIFGLKNLQLKVNLRDIMTVVAKKIL